MKKITTLLLCALTTMTFAQQKKTVMGVDITFSDEIKTKGGVQHQILGEKDNKIFTYGYNGSTIGGAISIGGKAYYNVWNDNWKMVNKGKQDNKKGDMKIGSDDYARTYMLNGEIYQLCSSFQRQEIDLYLAKINPKDFSISKTVKIHTINAKLKDQDNYSTRISKDKTKFAYIIYNAKGPKTEIIIKVYDLDLEKIAEFSETVNLPSTNITVKNFSIDKSGNVLFILDGNDTFLTKMRSRKNGSLKDLSNYSKLFQYNKKMGEVNSVDIKGDGYSILSMDYSTNENRVFLTGFYEKENKERTNGIFTRVYNSDNLSIVNEVNEDLSYEFVTENFTEREKRRAKRKSKKDKDFNYYTYKVKDVIAAPDGGSITMAERYRYYTTTTYTANGGVDTDHHYIFNEIVLFKYDDKGNIQWVKKVDKHQHTVDDDGKGGSFYYKLKNNSLYMVYVENVKMLQNCTFLVKLDVMGGPTKTEEIYCQDGFSSVVLTPSSSFAEMSENKTVFNGYMRKGLLVNKKKMTMVTFEF